MNSTREMHVVETFLDKNSELWYGKKNFSDLKTLMRFLISVGNNQLAMKFHVLSTSVPWQ